MATKDWITTSTKIDGDEDNALRMLCKRKSLTKSKLVRNLILEAIDSILHPGVLSGGQGIPTIGQHLFKYDTEKDNFLWQLDLGTQGMHVLCEDVSFKFLESLKNEIDKSLEQRENIIQKTGGKVIVPKKILKFKVK